MADKIPTKHGSNDQEAKKQKHKRKMTKIMGKMWAFPDADKFHKDKTLSTSSRPLDLETVGQNLDDDVYQHGRRGWEKFAFDIGAVFNTHISRRSKFAAAAKENLKNALHLLEKIDASLVKKASEAAPVNGTDISPSKIELKKRKKYNDADSLMNTHVPKKRNTSAGSASTTSKTLTLSQREEKAMEDLASYVEECGGDRQQVLSFHVTISHRGSRNKDEIAYFSPQGHRYRKKSDVVRFLGLTSLSGNKSSTNNTKRSSGSRSGINTGRPRNSRDCENEKKRLKKEIDKLLKAHGKTSKTLDDLRNEHSNDLNPIDDLVLLEKNKEKGQEISNKIGNLPDMNGFPRIPPCYTGDVLMVWDFLCTFFRVLSLEPISLDDFVSALCYSPQNISDDTHFAEEDESNSSQQTNLIPVYLAEAHLALLKLLLTDQSSDEWWWSTLESDVSRSEDDNDALSSEISTKMTDASTPVVKVDMADLLVVEEDPLLTTRWLQALEDVRTRKTNSGGPIKSAVKTAASITTNPVVKIYLQKSMRKWKGNAAGFTKRAVIWLIDRVREARPDLWGKKVSKEAVNEQTSKVAREAAAGMELFEEDADINNENGSNFEEASDDEDESEDDDDDDGEDDGYVDDEIGNKNSISMARRNRDNNNAPVTTSIPLKPPPTIVDLLLPPAKPTFNSDIVTPLTWPCLVGASVCRVFHRYKRQRNEVDDDLREFHSHPLLTIGERLRRERNAAQRIFSECVSPVLTTDEQNSPTVENAIDHLCCGKSYLELLPTQRLCVFRVLVEAAYDTHRVTKAIEENFRSRINAVKSLEMEEKRAKREAREEAASTDRSARIRLAEEKRESFLSKKRHELKRMNNYTSEYMESLSDNDIIEFDDQTKQAYNSLPKPESFNKSEVNAMVAKINEESAFETDSVLVFTIDEIRHREEEKLELLKDQLSSYGDIDTLYENGGIDRETSAKVDKLQREIQHLNKSFDGLQSKRTEAIDILNEAIEEGTVKELKLAIKTAKLAQLFGTEESNGGVWALDVLRDAALELKVAERRRRVTEAQKDLVAKRNKCFIRTCALGKDKYRNSVWYFDNDSYVRVWTETESIISEDDTNNPKETKNEGETNNCLKSNMATIGAKDEEMDYFTKCTTSGESNHQTFSRKEYHPSGLLAGLPNRNWGSHVTEKSLRSLIKTCDQRGIRECALKARIKEVVEAKGQGSVDILEFTKITKDDPDGIVNESKLQTDLKTSTYQSSGDEDDFCAALNAAKSEGYDVSLIESKSSAIGDRIRTRTKINSTSTTNLFDYMMGTVVGWSQSNLSNGENSSMENEMVNEETNSPKWQILLDNGGYVALNGHDIVEGLVRSLKWTNNCDGYLESNASFLCYRNGLGRFCGRQIDAPFSASTFSFAKQMIKREADFYTPLKNRSNWNEWGGRSAARNAWLSKMKDPNVDFVFVRDGLLTLETVFFQMSGGFEGVTDAISDEEASTNELDLNGRELLDDESYRFDIELESITGTPKSLWNSRETRAIFQEIINSCTSVEILALGLELMCRNCKLYLKANKVTSQYSFETGVSSTRRQNLWQQKQQESYY